MTRPLRIRVLTKLENKERLRSALESADQALIFLQEAQENMFDLMEDEETEGNNAPAALYGLTVAALASTMQLQANLEKHVQQMPEVPNRERN